MRKEKRQKKKDSLFKRIKHKLTLCLIFLPIIYLLFLLGNGIVKDFIFNSDKLKTIEATIIDKKNYLYNDKVQHRFSYSYEFYLNRKRYENDSQKHNKYKVGEIILVEYHPEYPIYNRVKKEN
ncbi:hypothetical protein [uncultured Polaribacter sp.]|uniref:hypothetical protein n=1 Tax=uncultured Polaribacter sp. TaxID=174711 RepID=UPI00259BC724|nr:hypothetical protein [uncultured Polaribacter sp.]